MTEPERIEIVLTGSLPVELVAELKTHFTVHSAFDASKPLEVLAELGPRIRGAVGNGMSGLSAQQIKLLPNLEIYSIMGVGLETTDLAACKAGNITVTTTPVLYDDVADIAISLALGVSRRIVQADKFVRSGNWQKGRMPQGRKFSGSRCGVLGLGNIGAAVAHRLEGFTSEIFYYDPAPRDVSYRGVASAVDLAKEVDILFLCAAGQPKGAGKPLFDRAMIDALGPNGIFINVARGWLADETELVAALREGRLAGAGLDVFDNEPNVPAELLALDNVVLTPHVASWTSQTMGQMAQCLRDDLVAWFMTGAALHPVKFK